MPGYTRPTIDAREFRDEFGAGADQWGPNRLHTRQAWHSPSGEALTEYRLVIVVGWMMANSPMTCVRTPLAALLASGIAGRRTLKCVCPTSPATRHALCSL